MRATYRDAIVPGRKNVHGRKLFPQYFRKVEDDGRKKDVIYPHYWTCNSRK